MELSVHREATVFDALQAEWNDLLGRAQSDCIFYTWEWHRTWWHSYQPGELLVLTCRERERLVGIAPLFVSESERGRTAQIIGCVDVTDYLDFIVDENHLQPVFEAFADYFAQERATINCFDLCNIPQASPTREILPDLLRERGFTTVVEPQEVCPVIDLPSDWGGYMLLLDKKQRHEVRRKMRRIQGSESAIDWYIVNGKDNLDQEISHFARLMAASDPEKERFLLDEGNMRFFKRIVPTAQDKGWLQLSFLTIDEERVAAYMNFVYGNRVMVYNSGHDHQHYSQLSPGIVLLAYNIQHAIKSGYKFYDFLRGSESYKYRMGGRDTAVLNIHAT